MTAFRCLLFVPAGQPELLAKAGGFDVDGLVLDLEDSVPLEGKGRARAYARAALPEFVRPGRQLWVRVNSTYSLLTKDDVRAVVGPGLDGLLLPKCDRPEHALYLDALLRDAEAEAGVAPGTVRTIPIIESAAALLKAFDIAKASARTVALQFGGEDFAADLGVERTREGAELNYARSMVAVAARAARLPALDTVYPTLHDDAGLRRDAEQGRALGLRGKLAIHPEQIATITEVYTPAPEQIDTARRTIAAYEAGEKAGLGAVQLDDRLIDAPIVSRARALVALADAISAREPRDEAAESSAAEPAAGQPAPP